MHPRSRSCGLNWCPIRVDLAFTPDLHLNPTRRTSGYNFGLFSRHRSHVSFHQLETLRYRPTTGPSWRGEVNIGPSFQPRLFSRQPRWFTTTSNHNPQSG